MDRRSWTDADIASALEAALEVEPSAELRARVRTAIADDPLPWRIRLRRFAPAFATAAAAFVVGFAILGVEREPVVTPEPEVVVHDDTRLWTPLRAPVEAETMRLVTHTAPRAGALEHGAPDVLISAGEAAALRRLIAGSHVDIPANMPFPDEVVIPLLAIDPIAVESTVEGVSQ